MPAEITPPSNTLNLYWETHAGTREQSRNPFGSGTAQPELLLNCSILCTDILIVDICHSL
jgi:hypothetical protein